MKRFMILFVSVFSCVMILTTAANAGCTNANLFGTYGFHEQGQFPGGGFSEFRSVGSITFDGKGNGNGNFTIWYSTFQVVGGQIRVSYNVAADCTFTYQDLDSAETFTGVIVDGGRQYFYLETTGDPMRSGEAVKIIVGQNKQ